MKLIDKDKIAAEIERIKANIKEYCVREGHDRRFDVVPEQLAQILSFIDILETKEVDEEYNGKAMLHILEKGVKQGRREILNNLWKPADGDDLPEVDREVIVLLSNNKVCYAHRPPESWDGKNIATGEVIRRYPVRYDGGGWNIPDVKWWLDLELPNMKE